MTTECTIECLHYIMGRDDVRCCGCGKYFENPIGAAGYDGATPVRGVMNNMAEYRLGIEHIGAGMYWPSILSTNRRAGSSA